jgi:hypothetical protein
MTWKSYAAVSGATVLAGWLASTEPSNAPSAVQAPSARPSPPAAPGPTDIELQAMRLQARLRPEREYPEPARDPFRFAARREAAARVEPAEPAAEPPPPPIEAAPRAPAVSLSGVAEDQVDGRTVRTAVLSSPAGVLLVREGEEILGFYRVDRIEADAVALVAIGDGASRRLTLR